MATTKAALNKCKMNLNVFPPTCLGEPCRLGAHSRWNKREIKIRNIYPTNSGGRGSFCACVLRIAQLTVYSAMLCSGQSLAPGHWVLTKDPVTPTRQILLAPFCRRHYPRELHNRLHVINPADTNGVAACQSGQCLSSGEKIAQVLAGHLIMLSLSFCSHKMEVIMIPTLLQAV